MADPKKPKYDIQIGDADVLDPWSVDVGNAEMLPDWLVDIGEGAIMPAETPSQELDGLDYWDVNRPSLGEADILDEGEFFVHPEDAKAYKVKMEEAREIPPWSFK